MTCFFFSPSHTCCWRFMGFNFRILHICMHVLYISEKIIILITSLTYNHLFNKIYWRVGMYIVPIRTRRNLFPEGGTEPYRIIFQLLSRYFTVPYRWRCAPHTCATPSRKYLNSVIIKQNHSHYILLSYDDGEGIFSFQPHRSIIKSLVR